MGFPFPAACGFNASSTGRRSPFTSVGIGVPSVLESVAIDRQGRDGGEGVQLQRTFFSLVRLTQRWIVGLRQHLERFATICCGIFLFIIKSHRRRLGAVLRSKPVFPAARFPIQIMIISTCLHRRWECICLIEYLLSIMGIRELIRSTFSSTNSVVAHLHK